MNFDVISSSLEEVLRQYGLSFAAKKFGGESLQVDDLMLVFGLTQEAKTRNKQYWGRELGMCWQRLVTELFRQTRKDFSGSIREGADEICDLVVGNDAIDTKYRIGSGDSGTLKKFRQYGLRLQQLGYRPVLLVLRDDNLPAAIAACVSGGWTVTTGQETYRYIHEATGFDLQSWLRARKNQFAG